jgi:hypothetical protein
VADDQPPIAGFVAELLAASHHELERRRAILAQVRALRDRLTLASGGGRAMWPVEEIARELDAILGTRENGDG